MKYLQLFLTIILSGTVIISCNKDAGVTLTQEVQEPPQNQTFVSLTKAIDVASVFFGTQTDGPVTKSTARIASVETIRDNRHNNAPMMYAINYTDGGFAIVSATKDYYPILAHADEGNFVYNEDIGGLVLWMEQTKEAIRQCGALDTKTKAQIRAAWRCLEPVDITPPPPNRSTWLDCFYNRRSELEALFPYSMGWNFDCLGIALAYGLPVEMFENFYDIVEMFDASLDYSIFGMKTTASLTQVGPLLGTQWHQQTPFNDSCFSILGEPSPAGCIPIAMAQIMNYHQHPSSIPWSSIPIDTVLTATVIRDIGTAASIKYYPSGSYPPNGHSNADIAFQSVVYGYNTTHIYHNPLDVQNEILNYQRPLYMGGTDWATWTGHAWVCDGVIKGTYVDEFIVELFIPTSPTQGYYVNINDYPYCTYLTSSLDYTYSGARYHYNWGWGGDNDGWFYEHDVRVIRKGIWYNLNYDRQNIYVSK